MVDPVLWTHCKHHPYMHRSFLYAAYLVVADEAYGRAIPSAFLDKMAAEFTAKYADKAPTAKEGSLTQSFGWVSDLMMP